MRSLDTLSPMRPKAEAGRAPTGEDPRAGGIPDFEAMLGAFESGTAPSGEAPAEATEDRTDGSPALPADPPVATAPGSALQALMALTGPAAGPVPAANPEAGLEAMVQRAAARAGSGPSPLPTAPALSISQVGLETHFAPVRHGLVAPATGSGPVANGSIASPVLPETGGVDADVSPSIVRDDAPRLSSPSIAPAPTAAVSEPPVAGPDRSSPAALRGAVHDLAAGSDDAVPAQGSPAPSSQTAVEQPSASTVTPAATRPAPAITAPPGVPATAAASATQQPTSLDGGQDRAAGAAAVSAASAHRSAGTARAPAAPDALGNPAGRGRTVSRGDRPEPAGAAASAPPAEGLSRGDLPEPAAVAQAGATQPVHRDPEPVRQQPDGLARPETPAERAAASVTRAKTDAEVGTDAASGGPSTAAPRSEMPAEPILQAGAPAPVPASPLRQIVDAVTAQLPAAASAAQARPSTAPTETGPLKILTLQLHPADLGTVLVRMRLQDGRLEMSLRTSREETAERLRKEGDLLSGLLREAGYEADTVTIQAGGAGPGESGSRGQGFATFAGSQGGQPDRQPGAATPDQSGRRPSPRADEAAMPTEEQNHETDSRGRDHGSLYL
ncbi:flagellar hook-length control protein FliK [Methylorubrum aminovorans]|uniref:flagellar hook-length control protein FliK n=1 Tax=Methylorubrum aminovorans TaxID=269069 RepID=UPI003C2C555C